MVLSHLWWWINNLKYFCCVFLINLCLYINVGGYVWEVRSPFGISSFIKNFQYENIETWLYLNRKKNESSELKWIDLFVKRIALWKIYLIFSIAWFHSTRTPHHYFKTHLIHHKWFVCLKWSPHHYLKTHLIHHKWFVCLKWSA